MTNDTSTATWRVFCAIEVPEQVRDSFVQRMDSLRRGFPEARASWSRPENIHLTLKFLGTVTISQVESFSNAVERAASGFPSFTLGVGEPGAFPPHGSPRVLWIGVNDLSGNLAELHARLEDESQQVGFAKEARTFHPHFTLARFREHRRGSKQSRPENNQLARALMSAHKNTPTAPMEISVSELLVIRSELSSTGSRYTVISRHRLGLSDKL